MEFAAGMIKKKSCVEFPQVSDLGRKISEGCKATQICGVFRGYKALFYLKFQHKRSFLKCISKPFQMSSEKFIYTAFMLDMDTL